MAAAKDDYRSLNGQEKAAILILSLNDDQTAKLFSMMDDEEIKELSQTMAGLGRVASGVIERLCVDFVDQHKGAGRVFGEYAHQQFGGARDERGFLGGRDAIAGDFDIYVGHLKLLVEVRCQCIFVARNDKDHLFDYT